MSKVATAVDAARPSRLVTAVGCAVALGLLLTGCAGSGKHQDRSSGSGRSGGSSRSGPSSNPSGASAERSSAAGPTGTATDLVPSTATDLVPSTAAPASADAPCRQWSCAPGEPVPLGGGYTVRLWSSAVPTAVVVSDRSTPVLELLRDGAHVQWWVGRSGFGWDAKIVCLPGRSGSGSAVLPHCAVLSDVGSHAGNRGGAAAVRVADQPATGQRDLRRWPPARRRPGPRRLAGRLRHRE